MKTSNKRTVPEKYEKIFSQYIGLRSELIPILQSVQGEEGFIPAEAISETARFLNISRSSVYGVVTFYTQFYLTPQGRNKIKVCTGTACHVRGASDIMKAIEKKLGIKAGESTSDFEFNVEKVACFGSCALAPVMVVNDKVYGKVTPAQAMEILDDLSK